jgi:hypothetical protein
MRVEPAAGNERSQRNKKKSRRSMPGHPTAEYGKRDTECFAAKNADLQTIAGNRVITIPAAGLQIPVSFAHSIDSCK